MVLSIKGTDVKVIDTVDLGGIVSHAVFTPDGKRALVSKFNDHKVSLLDINGDKVTYNSSICRPASGPTMWPWRQAARSRLQPTMVMPVTPMAASTP